MEFLVGDGTYNKEEDDSFLFTNSTELEYLYGLHLWSFYNDVDDYDDDDYVKSDDSNESDDESDESSRDSTQSD